MLHVAVKSIESGAHNKICLNWLGPISTESSSHVHIMRCCLSPPAPLGFQDLTLKAWIVALLQHLPGMLVLTTLQLCLRVWFKAYDQSSCESFRIVGHTLPQTVLIRPRSSHKFSSLMLSTGCSPVIFAAGDGLSSVCIELTEVVYPRN